MTGARKLAYDFILPLAQPGLRVLDVGAGDAPLPRMMSSAGCKVVALDHDATKLHDGLRNSQHLIRHFDLAADNWEMYEHFDLIVAVYSLQHMMEREAKGWLKLQPMLNVDGQMVVVGRHCPKGPVRETRRNDPLNGYNRDALAGLAMAAGFVLKQYRTYRYDGDEYEKAEPSNANAYIAVCGRWKGCD